jgi:hypothetical protein
VNQNVGKTHCPAGHEYAGDNLYVDPVGRRHCRTCRNTRKRERRHNARVAAFLDGWEAAIHGDVVHVPLGNHDRPALIDLPDLPLAAAHGWWLSNGYAKSERRTSHGTLTIYLHNLVLHAPPGMEVDHVSRDRLDNRRSNLRLATRREQCGNQGMRSDNTSGYRGVSLTRSGKWGAWIRRNGRSVHLGNYESPIAAALAYDAAAGEVFGEFANLNFPDEVAA